MKSALGRHGRTRKCPKSVRAMVFPQWVSSNGCFQAKPFPQSHYQLQLALWTYSDDDLRFPFDPQRPFAPFPRLFFFVSRPGSVSGGFPGFPAGSWLYDCLARVRALPLLQVNGGSVTIVLTKLRPMLCGRLAGHRSGFWKLARAG